MRASGPQRPTGPPNGDVGPVVAALAGRRTVPAVETTRKPTRTFEQMLADGAGGLPGEQCIALLDLIVLRPSTETGWPGVVQNRAVPRAPYPPELVGDEDWQLAAQTVWDALAALDEEQGETALHMSCSGIVQRAHAGLSRLADSDPTRAARALIDLRGSVDRVAALYFLAPRSQGGWFQDLAAAREGLERSAGSSARRS